MADERKKRIEEIRARKNQFKKMLEAIPGDSSNPAIPEKPIDTSSHTETSNSNSASTSTTISTNPSFRQKKRTTIKNDIILGIQKRN